MLGNHLPKWTRVLYRYLYTYLLLFERISTEHSQQTSNYADQIAHDHTDTVPSLFPYIWHRSATLVLRVWRLYRNVHDLCYLQGYLSSSHLKSIQQHQGNQAVDRLHTKLRHSNHCHIRNPRDLGGRLQEYRDEVESFRPARWGMTQQMLAEELVECCHHCLDNNWE